MGEYQLEYTKILDQREIATGIYRMEIAYDNTYRIKSGQFIDLYTNQRAQLLPRPISICDVTDSSLVLVYRRGEVGTGTYDFSLLEKGDQVKTIGPLGNGYSLDKDDLKDEDIVIMGGGIGIPPLLLLSKYIYHLTEKKPNVILGYKDEVYLADDFREFANVHIVTETGRVGIQGNVLSGLATLALPVTRIYSCGPMPMLKGVYHFAKERNIKAYISLEERMACGVGTCLGCVTKTVSKDHHTHVNNTRICKEGPVFDVSVLDMEA